MGPERVRRALVTHPSVVLGLPWGSRYSKRGYVVLGTVTTAALVIWLRT